MVIDGSLTALKGFVVRDADVLEQTFAVQTFA